MHDISEAVRYYLDQLRDGACEDAFFGLLDLGPEAMPLLIAAAAEPENHDVRANLVEVIWQYRRPEAVAFLGAALDNSEPAVWQQALDGLVVLGGPAAARQVREALERLAEDGARGASEDWLREALEQMVHADLGVDSAESGSSPDRSGM